MSTERIRLQLDLTERVVLRLDNLVEDTDASTRAEVARMALMIYCQLVESYVAGGRILIVMPDGSSRELLLPIFRSRTSP